VPGEGRLGRLFGLGFPLCWRKSKIPIAQTPFQDSRSEEQIVDTLFIDLITSFSSFSTILNKTQIGQTIPRSLVTASSLPHSLPPPLKR
jgi:hypothetical protein